MTKLIRQLLDFARKRELQPSDVDLRVLVTRRDDAARPDRAQRRRLARRDRSCRTRVWPRVDLEQMTQVVMNLVMNAVHASPPGGRSSIALGRAPALPPAEDGRGEQQCSRIEVRDEGTGIPTGRAASHLRAVLHDQGRRRRNRPGSVGRVRNREGPRGLDRRGQSSRRGERLHRVASRWRSGVTRVLVVDDERAMADAMAERARGARARGRGRVERGRGVLDAPERTTSTSSSPT